MIIIENVIINGKEFIKTYSDSGNRIERNGAIYNEAVDPIGFGRVYKETDELIQIIDTTVFEQDMLNADAYVSNIHLE